jgi:hypothetical protein
VGEYNMKNIENIEELEEKPMGILKSGLIIFIALTILGALGFGVFNMYKWGEKERKTEQVSGVIQGITEKYESGILGSIKTKYVLINEKKYELSTNLNDLELIKVGALITADVYVSQNIISTVSVTK